MNKFIVNSAKLLKALQVVSKVMATRVAVPIIESYLFQVTGNKLTISGTDLHSTLRVVLGIETKSDAFSLVMAPTVIKYLQKIDEQPLVITATEIIVKNVVRCTEKTVYKVEIEDMDGRALYSGENPVDFPKVPICNLPLMEVQTDFINEFKDLLVYVSGDELRPAMTGINFSKQGEQLELCATDGHRVKVVDVSDLVKVTDLGALSPNFILPAKPAKILAGMKLKSALKVCAKRTQVRDASADSHAPCEYREIVNVMFSGEVDGINFELISRAIDERYPDYRNVIPSAKNAKTLLVIDSKKSFLKVVDKALLFANKTTHQLRISLNGANKISAEDLDFNNEYSAVIPGSSYVGDEIQIGFNGEFLKEICSNVSEPFTFEFSAPNKCGVIRDGRATIVCMPVMLNQYV